MINPIRPKKRNNPGRASIPRSKQGYNKPSTKPVAEKISNFLKNIDINIGMLTSSGKGSGQRNPKVKVKKFTGSYESGYNEKSGFDTKTTFYNKDNKKSSSVEEKFADYGVKKRKRKYINSTGKNRETGLFDPSVKSVTTTYSPEGEITTKQRMKGQLFSRKIK